MVGRKILFNVLLKRRSIVFKVFGEDFFISFGSHKDNKKPVCNFNISHRHRALITLRGNVRIGERSPHVNLDNRLINESVFKPNSTIWGKKLITL
jgi:hypothetical protein